MDFKKLINRWHSKKDIKVVRLLSLNLTPLQNKKKKDAFTFSLFKNCVLGLIVSSKNFPNPKSSKQNFTKLYTFQLILFKHSKKYISVLKT